MRSMSRRARWATSARVLCLALVIATPTVFADDKPAAGTTAKKKKRSINDCTFFDQQDREDEEGVDFTVRNSCDMPVACSVRWAVTCAPESRKRRSRKFDTKAFQLDTQHGITVTASSARCGNDGWAVNGITWSCAPAGE